MASAKEAMKAVVIRENTPIWICGESLSVAPKWRTGQETRKTLGRVPFNWIGNNVNTSMSILANSRVFYRSASGNNVILSIAHHIYALLLINLVVLIASNEFISFCKWTLQQPNQLQITTTIHFSLFD
jgi:hypothetical protein